MANARGTRKLKSREQEINAGVRKIAEIKKDSALFDLENQCRCWHKSEKEYELALTNTPGKPICKICKKVIDISEINQEDFNKSFAVIDKFIDLMKLSLEQYDENSRDLKASEDFSKLQLAMHTMLPDAFTAYKKRNTRGKNNNQNRNDNRSPL